MLKSPFVKREQAFYMQINLRDIFKPSEEFKDIENKDTLMVRGIIDTYFEEDNEIVLVDYKTDFVNEENRNEVIDKYNKQLEIYSKALEKLTGKKVKEAYIYLFGIEEEVLYKF
jgi:ATP-dependent helicase/nuclease subunit A